MILSVTFSKPSENVETILGKKYIRIKIKHSTSAGSELPYYGEFFTSTQVFHKKFSEEETLNFIEEHCGKTFKNCTIISPENTTTYMTSRKGKITKLVKPNNQTQNIISPLKNIKETSPQINREKNRILKEGTTIPFLVQLGIMASDGKIKSSKFNKFKQINRFLEIFSDILPEIKKTDSTPYRILDFGSGKSYLTFAVHYLMTEILHLPCEIFGLDLKKDVIDYCNSLASQLKLSHITFKTGSIQDFEEKTSPDIIITLHACDTATDYALDYALRHNAKAILSVPCCQHEINSQLKKNSLKQEAPFSPFIKYGLVKERFSALATDLIRAEILESEGYKVQMMEFIDDEMTPKNIMIRAVKQKTKDCQKKLSEGTANLIKALNISQTLLDLRKPEL